MSTPMRRHAYRSREKVVSPVRAPADAEDTEDTDADE
jgi:hypothetical protein